MTLLVFVECKKVYGDLSVTIKRNLISTVVEIKMDLPRTLLYYGETGSQCE